MLPGGQGEFRFTVTETTNWQSVGLKQVVTASHNANGDIVFGDLFFTREGTYTFEVSEDKGTLTGIKYDETVFTVTVIVEYNDGLEVVSVTVSDGMQGPEDPEDPGDPEDPEDPEEPGSVDIVFNNVFTPPDITLTLLTPTAQTSPLAQVVGRKSMQNKALENGEFNFEIRCASTSSLVATGINRDNGFLEFSSIPYTHSDVGKTFTYIVSEVIPEEARDNVTQPLTHNRITYDNTTYEIKVKVVIANQATGLLSTIVEVTGKTVNGVPVTEGPFGPIAFSNKYSTLPVLFDTLRGTKTLTGGRVLRDEEFEFELEWVSTTSARNMPVMPDEAGCMVKNGITSSTSGAFTFGSMLFFEEDIGQHVYKIKEVIPAELDPEITYDNRVYTVAVTVSKNQYSGFLEVTQRVTAINGEEVIGNVPIAFTNTFTPAPVYMTGMIANKQLLGGRTLKSGEYSFIINDITDLENVKPAGTGTHDEFGNIVFTDLKFDRVGSYKFSIREALPAVALRDPMVTYDTTEFTMSITVSADAEGALSLGPPVYGRVNTDGSETGATSVSFRNVFNPAPVSVSVTGSKALTGGRNLRNEEFSFEIKNSSGVAVATGKNNSGGLISFTDVLLSSAGDHILTVSEVIPPAELRVPNVTYDTTLYTIMVRVNQDNSDGRLSLETQVITGGANNGSITFTNVFVPDAVSVTFPGVKTLAGGRNLSLNEFAFIAMDITDSDPANHKLAATGTNNAAEVESGTIIATGDIVFEPIKLYGVGTYTFVVFESIPAETLRDSMVTYDETVYTVKVTVVQNPANGELLLQLLVITGGNGGGDIVFTNTFTPNEITATFPLASKTLAGGRTLRADEFEFSLTDVTMPTPKLSEPILVRNTAGGSVSFGTLIFSGADIGTHTYVIEEVEPATVDPDITYDHRQYTIEITVGVNNNTGALTLSDWDVIGEESTIAFENVYTPHGLILTLEGTKVLTGRDIVAGEFSISVVDKATGNEVAAGSSRDDGDIAFSTIQYQEDDIGKTFKYTVAETSISPLMGVTYDDTVYNVTVTLTQDHQTGLVTPVVDIESGPIEFNNTFISPYLEITKEDSSGNLMQGVTFRLEHTTGSGWIFDGDFVTNEHGVARIVPLIPGGDYRVTEISLKGYYSPEPYEFTVLGDEFMDPGYRAIIWTNHVAQGSATALVVSSGAGSIPLAGVRFGIYAADAPNVLVAEAVSDGSGYIKFDGLPLKVEGPSAFDKTLIYVDGGQIEYIIRELNLINGYLPVAAPFSFTLSLYEPESNNITMQKAPRPPAPPPEFSGGDSTEPPTTQVTPPPGTTTPPTGQTTPPDDQGSTDSAPASTDTEESYEPGGRYQAAPPAPNSPGHAIVAGADGIYVELNEDGIPFGAWSWSPDEGMWIFDSEISLFEWLLGADTPAAGASGLPGTGDSRINPILYVFGLIFGLVSAVLILHKISLYSGRRKPGAN